MQADGYTAEDTQVAPAASRDRAPTEVLPADLVPFELVVFERDGDSAQVTVQGMTTCCDIEVVVFEARGAVVLSVMGVAQLGEVRPFDITVDVDVEDGRDLEVRGLFGGERVPIGDLPEKLPLVCGADPGQADIAGDFLHRRGTRYVLMHGGDDGQQPSTLVA